MSINSLIWRVLLLLAVFQCVNCDRSHKLQLEIDEKNGNFVVSIDDQIWLEGDEITIHSAGTEYSSAAADESAYKLHVVQRISSSTKFMGEDSIGTFEKTSLFLRSSDGLAEMECAFRLYERSIVFEQYFPSQLNGTSTGNKDMIVSGFPTFTSRNVIKKQGQIGVQKGYAHWVSWHYDDKVTSSTSASRENMKSDEEKRRRLLVAPGFISPAYGLWEEMGEENDAGGINMSGGVSGTGVLALYDSTGKTATVLSPLSGFMAQSHTVRASAHDKDRPCDNDRANCDVQLAYGIMGVVDSVPQGYTQSTVLTLAGGECGGVNCAMRQWGQLMRKFYGVKDAAAAAVNNRDPTLSSLGYSTDNGMYYYYNTDENNTDTYQNTLVNVYNNDVSLEKIPYKYVLLDSWWYSRAENTDTGGGVTEWWPRSDIFPDGIEYLVQQTGWLVQAHNRYWSDQAVYATANGGDYEFGIDNETHGAVPLSASFWEELFRKPRQEWNLVVYEQDWLNQEFDVYFPAMMQSISLARQWLLQMATGARKNGITVQYCMPYVRHLLQSLEVNSIFGYADSNIVTQARASDDHKPSEDEDQWRIGGQAMLLNALGLRPSKDGFWSSSSQPGNPYGDDKIEEFPELQAMVATLSAGPVQVGDGLGFSDRKLILRSCRSDGKLLHPFEPAMPIDAQMLQATFQTQMGGSVEGPKGEVWYTFSGPAQQQKQGRLKGEDNQEGRGEVIESGAHLVHYLSVMDLQAKWSFTLEEFHAAVQSRAGTDTQLFEHYWVVERASVAVLASGGKTVATLSKHAPLMLQACGLPDFQLYSLVPAVPAEAGKGLRWSVLGELDKWVGISPARVFSTTMDATGAGASVLFECVSGETLDIGFISPKGELVTTSCQCAWDMSNSSVPFTSSSTIGAVRDMFNNNTQKMVASSDGQCVRRL